MIRVLSGTLTFLKVEMQLIGITSGDHFWQRAFVDFMFQTVLRYCSSTLYCPPSGSHSSFEFLLAVELHSSPGDTWQHYRTRYLRHLHLRQHLSVSPLRGLRRRETAIVLLWHVVLGHIVRLDLHFGSVSISHKTINDGTLVQNMLLSASLQHNGEIKNQDLQKMSKLMCGCFLFLIG